MKYLAGVMVITAACGGGGGPSSPVDDSPPPDFVAAETLSVPEIHIAAGDIDNDGDVDLYVTTDTGSLVSGQTSQDKILRNDGLGTLVPEDGATLYQDCTRPRLEKIDQDEYPDVVCLPMVFGGASARLNESGTSFISAGHDTTSVSAARAWPALPSTIIVPTADGLLALSVSPNDTQMASTSVATGDFSRGMLAVADLDGDGKPELIASKSATYSVFSGADQSRHDVAGASGDLETADLNRDGHPDVLAIVGSTIAISIVQGSAPAAPVTVDGPQVEADHFIVDYDGDGIADLLFIGVGPQVYVMRGDGAGSLKPPESLLVAGAVPTYMTGRNLSAVADFDHDGKIDLAISDVQTHVVRIYKGR